MEDEKIKKIGVGGEEVCEWGVVTDFSASAKSHCTGICLQNPRGVPSPKLMPHFASSGPDPFPILRHSPVLFSTFL